MALLLAGWPAARQPAKNRQIVNHLSWLADTLLVVAASALRLAHFVTLPSCVFNLILLYFYAVPKERVPKGR